MREFEPTTAIRLHKRLDAIWRTPPGLGRLTAVNHTIVGRRFVITAFLFFGIGGTLAMLIRAQLATPRSAFMGPEIYNQVFTLHGTVMMFLFAIPLFEGLAMYLLPKMLGARDMAFPRMSAYGYWCYLFGGSILIAAMLVGVAPDGGWFMYTPLSSRPHTPGISADVWLIGVTFVEISALSAAIEIAVTVLKLRSPGMSLDRMPLFAWYMLVTALMMLVGFPPLIVGSILLELERAFDLPFFDPARGGDPLLWQHLFWLFGHPEVYIIFLPAAGVVSTVLPALVGREIVGYLWIVVSIVALAFLSFGLWVHHMFTVGIPHLALAFFSAASTAVAVPTAVQVFAWLATLLTGHPQLKAPMLFLLGFFFVFTLGGLTGVMLAIVPFNWQVHDTHFVVAHLHYVLVGGFVFPMLAAAYYWLPHFTGRVARASLAVPAFWMIFIGFNLTFLVMHLTGLAGMPRRVYTFSPGDGWTWMNLVSSVGAFLMAIGFALFTIDVLTQWLFGRRAARDPWRAGTLEWTTAMPPPSYTFASLPRIDGRAPAADEPNLARELARGRGYLGFVRDGRLETLAVETTTGRAEQVVRLPAPSWLPLVTATTTGTFFLAALFKAHGVALLSLAATLAAFLLWTRSTGERRDVGPVEIGRGEHAPFHSEVRGAPAAWAMTFALVADAAAFGALAFGLLFLSVVGPNWPPPALVQASPVASAAAALALLGAAWSSRRAVALNTATVDDRERWLLAAAGASGLAVAALSWLIGGLREPTSHAHAAGTLVLLTYVALHAALGLVYASYGIWRCRTGHVSAVRMLDLRIGASWQGYTAIVGVLSLLLVHALPRVIAS
jgi:cytochrome c oxidase subunit I+III